MHSTATFVLPTMIVLLTCFCRNSLTKKCGCMWQPLRTIWNINAGCKNQLPSLELAQELLSLAHERSGHLRHRPNATINTYNSSTPKRSPKCSDFFPAKNCSFAALHPSPVLNCSPALNRSPALNCFPALNRFPAKTPFPAKKTVFLLWTVLLWKKRFPQPGGNFHTGQNKGNLAECGILGFEAFHLRKSMRPRASFFWLKSFFWFVFRHKWNWQRVVGMSCAMWPPWSSARGVGRAWHRSFDQNCSSEQYRFLTNIVLLSNIVLLNNVVLLNNINVLNTFVLLSKTVLLKNAVLMLGWPPNTCQVECENGCLIECQIECQTNCQVECQIESRL